MRQIFVLVTQPEAAEESFAVNALRKTLKEMGEACNEIIQYLHFLRHEEELQNFRSSSNQFIKLIRKYYRNNGEQWEEARRERTIDRLCTLRESITAQLKNFKRFE